MSMQDLARRAAEAAPAAAPSTSAHAAAAAGAAARRAGEEAYCTYKEAKQELRHKVRSPQQCCLSVSTISASQREGGMLCSVPRRPRAPPVVLQAAGAAFSASPDLAVRLP